MDNPPNANIHTIVKAQIVFLLSTLTEDNFDRNQLEIRSLSEQHGLDTYLHFIRRLIIHSQARLASSAPPSAFDTSTALTFRLLVQETQRLARDPFLADRFREGIDRGEGDAFRHFDLLRFADRVALRPLERLVLASAIVSSPSRLELSTQAMNLIRHDFENAVLALCQHPSFDHADLSPQQVAKLMSNLLSDSNSETPVLDLTQRQALIAAAQAKYGLEIVAPILQRIFPTLSLPPGTSLVQTLIQLGPEITSDVDTVCALLQRFGISDSKPPRDDQLVEIMSNLARLAAEGTIMCDVGALVRALSSFNVTLNWANVIKAFDLPDRHGVDTATLKLLIAILLNCPRDAEPHAVIGFWGTWANSMYQLKLLDALLSLPADTFNFVSLPGRRIVTVDDVALASPTIKSLAANVQSHTWNSLDVFEVLVRLADSESAEIRSCVRDMLDKALKISAELVQMGLLQVPDAKWNDIRVEYSRKLLAMFLAGHPNHQLVFMRLWQIEPTYLTDAFRDFYEENPLNISRILDVAQDLKVSQSEPQGAHDDYKWDQILENLLEVRPFTFALDVASLASRREYLNLDKWLADNVTAHGAEFLRAMVAFLEVKMESEKVSRMSDPAVDSRTLSLNPHTITIFLRTLRNNSAKMPREDIDYCLEVRNSCLQVHPRLMGLIPGSDIEPGLAVVNYTAEIEGEVDAIYKQMYDEQTSIDEVIALLQRSKTSTDTRDHEIFSCMLHFLFDEYKFFQSYYPARELAMTGYLFGSIIHHELVDSIPLGIAIRYVVDALNCPPETNLFKFGLQALSRFETRLAEWQPLCQALLRIPHLMEVRPDLTGVIHRAIAVGGDGSRSNADMRGISTGLTAEPAPVFTAIHPDKLDAEIIEPPEELSDKVLFIVNNLAPNNFDSKLSEMKEQFDDAFARWFANYLVDQRISIEPNNHQLYLRFLDALDKQVLSKFILQETFIKAAAVLNSERTMQVTSERLVLKNIASWLGAITLARDKPIRHKNLSFKDLLIEGYDHGRLIVAIPFVCKTLEPCSKSKVFKPPNPWLMAVISLLAELYHYADIKLNLKFEIEMLCKGLDIDLDTVEATTVVRSRSSAGDTGPAIPEYVTDIDSMPMNGFDPAHMQGDSQVMPIGPTSAAEPQRAVGAHIESILSSLATSVVVSAQLAPYNANHSFKRAVQLAIDRAVREIIVPVVERSVTIAGISTRELVAKDFASEPSEDKLRKAGHLMAQKLAGSLALVTCKEPLKSNLGGHLRSSLVDHGFSEQTVSEQVLAILVQDNVDIACAAIEKAAMERAVTEVDEGFAPSYEARRRYRDLRNGQAFWDSQAPHSNFSTSLPDPLRIKPTGLQPHQAAVYEDFALDAKRVAVAPMSRPSSTVSYARNEHLNPALYAASPAPEPALAAHPALQHQEAMERFTAILRDLEGLIVQLPIQSLAALPPNHDLRHLVRQILFVAANSVDRHRTPLLMSQKIVQLLYKTSSQLGREIYVALLDQLCHSFEEVAKEAITWLLYAEDERKLNIPVTVTLLRSGLVNTSLQDQQLAKNLFTDPRPSLQNFAAGLIRECLSSDPPVASQNQLTYSIEVLGQLAQAGKANEEVNRLLDDLRGVRRPSVTLPTEGMVARQPSVKPETEQLREKLFVWFQQWVTIFQRSHSPEKAFVPFISQLTKQGILKVEDISSFFFRVCAEASVNSYIKCMAAGEFDYAFQALDAMSRLIVYIIKYHGDASGIDNDQAKVHYLTKILSIFVLVFANMHEEQGVLFQQKPFFRFFSSLISDLHSIAEHLGSAYFHLLIAISDTFSSLQPTYFPGFAFSWLCLISHRLFMPKLLLSENREGWSAFHKLLLSLFKFLAPFLKEADLQLASRDLYRGSLRLLLVLLHDFPEFLSEYYFSLCDVIPPRCIQLRNIILSAFPMSIILPDPHLRNTKLDSIPEMGPIPPILSDFASGLKSADLRNNLDQYLFNRGTPSFLTTLKDRLRLPGVPEGSTESYNLSLINSLVMYIGVSSVAQAKTRSGSSVFVASDPGVVALQYLASNLDVEGQHHLLSSMVLHLRYPNAHTHWFSSLLLHLFVEVKDDRFREVMTRVLLERFIVHRPHPWGALVTFIELLRNSKYEFWNKEFIRVAPEVTMLLESVARSIYQP
ncbi:Not1-domain-containing protein [Rhizopogon vinicolor AM-OR11-026]|uniref:General negative regulator of transcription subunit 1 n=1 Tax=Rhizopogon vinicolor AM-OR11-026 TaxID=1314800 RepID=A0A1B7NG42_9AGAM|nr:Not1-domain-containing protein [Rhizopogon vinicolor AM-OR11-026]